MDTLNELTDTNRLEQGILNLDRTLFNAFEFLNDITEQFVIQVYYVAYTIILIYVYRMIYFLCVIFIYIF